MTHTKFKFVFRHNKTDSTIELFYKNDSLSCYDLKECSSEEIIKLVEDVNALLLVRDGDDGIRSVGNLEECFYCGSKVGKYHKPNCVILKRKVKYSVLSDGEIIGTYTHEDPIIYNIDDNEYHKNESSWCTGNAVDDIVLLKTKKSKSVWNKILELDEEEKCPCGILEFKVEESYNWLEENNRFHLLSVEEA